MAYTINHTCHTDFASCKFLHWGITNAPSGGRGTEYEGFVRGRRTSGVFVKVTRTSGVFVNVTRRMERDAEFFVNYGTEFRFAGGWVCHTCRPGNT